MNNLKDNKSQIDSEPRTTLIVGAGAVENAWMPIKSALKDLIAEGIDVNSDIANVFFAHHVYQMRFFAHAEIKIKKDLQDYYQSLKKTISAELRIAQDNNTISPRKELYAILEKFVFANTCRVITINTNWDTVIDCAINSYCYDGNNGKDIEVHHIHGSTNDCDLIYLPSEIVKEPYRLEEEAKKLNKMRLATCLAIENSTTLILYGISLEPLDAELIQIVASGISSPKLKKIIIINPDYAKVAQRIKLLMNPIYPIMVECYLPDNLNSFYARYQ